MKKTSVLVRIVVTASLLCLIAAGTLAASPSKATAASKSTTVVAGTVNDFGGLDPFGAASAGRNAWIKAVYQALCVIHDRGTAGTPMLAKTIKKINDLTYDITIYNYITDSAGNKITAKDVAYCYNKAKNGGLVTKMGNMASCTVVGDYTVRLVMTNSNLGTLDDLLQRVYIVSQKAYEASGDGMASKVIATGPYVISEMTPGSQMVLTKRKDYWQKNEDLTPVDIKANADKVILKYIGEAAQLSIALESGTIDLALNMSGLDVDNFLVNGKTPRKGYSMATVLSPFFNALMLNMDPKGMWASNLKLRQAVLTGINKEDIVEGVLSGKGEACFTLGSAVYPDVQSSWKANYFNYDEAKAKSLLAQSGFKQKTPIRIMLDGDANRKKEAEIVQAQLLSMGLQSQILAYDTALYNKYKYDATQWDIMLDNYYSPDLIVNCWSHVFFPENYPMKTSANNLSDSKLVQLIKNASTTAGHTAQNVDKANTYINDLAMGEGTFDPYIYVFAKSGIDIFMNSFEGACYAWACSFAPGFVSAAN